MQRTMADESLQTATLASGCFWCTEALLKRIEGVRKIRAGYAGGWQENPTYEDVCSGRSGHAECVQVRFDPETISYKQLLLLFFATFDPTQKNRQGNDIGPQYRSVIFTHTKDQEKIAAEVIKKLNDSNQYSRPIVTDIQPIETFYKAEDYHQNFYENNTDHPYCKAVIDPKLSTFIQKTQ